MCSRRRNKKIISAREDKQQIQEEKEESVIIVEMWTIIQPDRQRRLPRRCGFRELPLQYLVTECQGPI